jgi:hypothetical protein
MKLLKKLNQKYLSISLSTLIVFMMVTGVTSCKGCNKTLDAEGKIEVSANKTSLQGDEKEVELTFKRAGDENTVAKLSNFELAIQVTSTTGSGKINYIINGASKAVKVGAEAKEKLSDLLSAKEDGMLASADMLTAKFTFDPEATTPDMTTTFQVIDTMDGNKVISEVIVTWKPVAVDAFELTVGELEVGEIINNTNKFKLKITKVGGQVVAGDEAKLVVQVTQNPSDASAATIKGIVDQLPFVAADIKNGLIEKELEVTPGTAETTFTLQLKDNGKNISTAKAAIFKAPGVATYQLEVDKKNIEDGATEVVVTVKKGTEVLQATDLEKLKLAIKRVRGSAAKIGGINQGKLEFKGANALTLSVDKKSASKKLIILPGTDKKAKFELKLVDDKGSTIAGTEQAVEWSNGIDLKVALKYDSSSSKINCIITNNGKVEANGLKLDWKRNKGKNVLIENKEKGDITIGKLGAKDNVIKALPVDWKGDTHGEFEFTLSMGTEKEYIENFPFVTTTPQVTIKLEGSKNLLKGDKEKEVKFTVTAGNHELTEVDLTVIKLVYTATGGAKLDLKGKTTDAQGKSLKDLLGVTKLAANASQTLTLMIDNTHQAEAIFTDIKLQGSENEDANKVKEVTWEGGIKVAIFCKRTSLKGVGQAKIEFTNNSGFKLEEAQLKKLTFEYTATKGKLKKGMDDSNGKNLWKLLGKSIDTGQEEVIELDVDNESQATVNFTDLKLTGSADTTEIAKIEWEGAISLEAEFQQAKTDAAALSAGVDSDLKGGKYVEATQKLVQLEKLSTELVGKVTTSKGRTLMDIAVEVQDVYNAVKLLHSNKIGTRLRTLEETAEKELKKVQEAKNVSDATAAKSAAQEAETAAQQAEAIVTALGTKATKDKEQLAQRVRVVAKDAKHLFDTM